MTQRLPDGIDEETVRDIIRHYENKTPGEAAREHHAAFRKRYRNHKNYAWVEIPKEVLPEIHR